MKDPSAEDPRAPCRHLEPPITPDETTETVDGSTPPEAMDDGYREQQWLVRTIPT